MMAIMSIRIQAKLLLRGVQYEKVLTNDMVEKVVSEVEKKASELENN